MSPSRLIAAVLACGLFAGAVRGQVRIGPKGPIAATKKGPQRITPQQGPELLKTRFTPAAEPFPPLKYTLLPPYEDRKPGNGVPFYYRAVLSIEDGDENKRFKKLYDSDDWLDGPVDKLPRDDVRKFLAGFRTTFEHLKIATHREECKWDWRMRDLSGIDAIAFLLPEIQESRQLARLLHLRIRLAIAERRYDDAIESLQMGYKLARDVAEPPTLINSLVGVAIATVMHASVRDFVAAPDSPNLFWALSTLPGPLVDLRPAVEYEMHLPMTIAPFLRDAETADRPAEEWNALLTKAFVDIYRLESGDKPLASRWQARMMAAGFVVKGYPRAKRELIEWGFAQDKVEKMPVGQVVSIHQNRVYRYMYHEVFKWVSLPPAQAIPGLKRSEEKLKRDGYLAPPGRSREIVPLATLLMPAVRAAMTAQFRLEVRTAGLRAVEAVRMHAAANGGKLPRSLAEITVVPVPVNPFNGKPFEYKVQGKTATLLVPSVRPEIPQVGWKFELSVR